MTVGQALSIWEEAGKPIIHLGPGENCFGLEKLLSHRDINERHLEAVKHWLEERQR
jgi:signal recognition particle GTPase